MRHALKLAICSTSLVTCQAFAGAILQTETKEYHVEPPAYGTTRVLAQGNLLRLEINSVTSAEDGLLIFRGDRNEMLVADTELLEYFVIDDVTMNAMAQQISGAIEEMNAMLESMPPGERAEARKEMELQMPELHRGPETPSILNTTGKRDMINGYDCEYYEVMKLGKKTRDMCVAAWENFEGGEEAEEAMMALGKFFERMHEVFAETGGTDFMSAQQQIFAHMRELGGYPVYARDYDESGALESESTLTDSREDTIDVALFAAPEGYRRGDIF